MTIPKQHAATRNEAQANHCHRATSRIRRRAARTRAAAHGSSHSRTLKHIYAAEWYEIWTVQIWRPQISEKKKGVGLGIDKSSSIWEV